MENEFEDLRPYFDSEINQAMLRIVQDVNFDRVANYVFPDENLEVVKATLRTVNSIAQFQSEIMKKAVRTIVDKTIDNLTFSGLERLDKSKKYLFVANHRDIMLDSALLQVYFIQQGFPTSEITFGSNLMQGDIVIDIGKSNKMFKVKRGGSPKEFYKNSLELSHYIRYALTQKGESIWIAQRNGRTKDGIDLTEQGLIRMFSMSGDTNLVDNLAELNIVPVSISYQWETCDALKARELYLSSDRKYIKAPGEDLMSILTGINTYKGDVHLAIGEPITRDHLRGIYSDNKTVFLDHVAKLIDQSIYSNYQLFDTHFIAYDILHSDLRFADKYTQANYIAFIDRMEKLITPFEEYSKELEKFFLNIYANPVKYCYPDF